MLLEQCQISQIRLSNIQNTEKRGIDQSLLGQMAFVYESEVSDDSDREPVNKWPVTHKRSGREGSRLLRPQAGLPLPARPQ